MGKVKEIFDHYKGTVAMISFYFGLSIELIILLIDKSDYINPIEGRLFQVTFVLFLISAALTEYNKKEWILILIFCLIGSISYFVTSRNEIIRIVIFIAGSKNIKLEKALKYIFFITTIGISTLMLASTLGIYGRKAIETDFGRGGVELRYCLGIGHPNALHCMIWAIILLGMYLYFDKIKLYHFIVLFLINIAFYKLTVSRAGVFITAFSILMTMFMKYAKKWRDKAFLYLTGIAGTIFVVLFSILAAYYSTNLKILAILDRFLTGRVSISYRDSNLSFWSLFSNEINQKYVDMGYIKLFYWYGIIPGIIYIALVCYMIWKCYKRHDYMGFVILVSFSVYTLVEAHAISVYLMRNYVILLLIGEWSKIFGTNQGHKFYLWDFKEHIR